MVAHFYPGIGDPIKLPIARFEGLLERIQDILDVTNADMASDQISRSKREHQRLLDAGDPKTWALYE